MMDWIVCSNLWNCYNYSKTILPHRGIYAMLRTNLQDAISCKAKKQQPGTSPSESCCPI